MKKIRNSEGIFEKIIGGTTRNKTPREKKRGADFINFTRIGKI